MVSREPAESRHADRVEYRCITRSARLDPSRPPPHQDNSGDDREPAEGGTDTSDQGAQDTSPPSRSAGTVENGGHNQSC